MYDKEKSISYIFYVRIYTFLKLYLYVSYDEDIGKCITLLKARIKKYEYLTGDGKYADFDWFKIQSATT